MVILNDTVSLVLNGYWNNLFTQGAWLAENVFEHQEISIQFVETRNTPIIVFGAKDILIKPSVDQFEITCTKCSDPETVNYFEAVCNRFVQKAITPQIVSYGFNITLLEKSPLDVLQYLDDLKDNDKLIECGAKIIKTSLKRQLLISDKIYNFTFKMSEDTKEVQFYFNWHNEYYKPSEQLGNFDGKVSGFISEVSEFIKNVYGFDMEE